MESLLTDFKYSWYNHPEWWFSKCSEHDEHITIAYGHLLDIPISQLRLVDPIIAILVLDQLPRHVHRNKYSHHIIEYYLQTALQIVNEHIDTEYVKQLSVQEWTFFMLPLRHSKLAKNITFVIDETWKRLQASSTSSCIRDEQVYKRYLRATYLQFLKDVSVQRSLIDFNYQCKISPSQYEEILYFHSKVDRKNENEINKVNKNPITFQDTIIDTLRPIIVSLSGGVDSMVCLYMIKHAFPNANISAVHINYDNRVQCKQEVLFLKDWCFNLDVPLHVRKIREIHREQCMKFELRELYESYTRDVRYSTYKSIHGKEHIAQVILGHNKDDCLENIMTNISHKNKYDNLCGMLTKSSQDNVEFLRPLLYTTKDDIVAFAKLRGIPFLPNSTPTWSQRGQIRNDLVPCLDKWDTQFIPSLFSLNDTMASLYKVLLSLVTQFIDRGTKSNNYFISHVDISDIQEETLFWKEVVLQLYNIAPSCKSIGNLVIAVKKLKTEHNTIPLNGCRKVMLTKDMVVKFIMKSSSHVSIDICVQKCE